MHCGFMPIPDINPTDSPQKQRAPVSLATSPVSVTRSSSTVSDLSPHSAGSISISPLPLEDPFKEKVENLKLTIERLQNQLALERLQNRVTPDLAARLQKETRENTSLRGDLQALQARLEAAQKLALSHSKMAAAMPVEISASSKMEPVMQVQLLEENTRLKEEVAAMKLAQAPPTEKDQEIMRLNKCNAELKESAQQQAMGLQMKLKQTAEMCHQLAGQLDQDMGGQRLPKMTQTLTQFRVNGHQGGLEQENEQLKDHVTCLNQQLQEVIDMNTRWQAYNKQREEHIGTLVHKLKTMEDKVASNDKSLQLSEQQQADVDRIILQYKQKVELAEEENQKLADENRGLRVQLDRVMAANMEKEDTIRRLQEQVTRAQTTAGSSSLDTERLQMLEHQVQLCTEDFESERHDRERAQSRVEELEQELQIVRRQLEQFQGRQMDDILERRRAAMQYYREEYQRQHPGYPQATQLIGRGLIQSDCVEEDSVTGEDGEGYDTIDGCPDMVQHFEAGESALQRAEPEDTLQCPKCRKEFPISKHELLLEHTEACV